MESLEVNKKENTLEQEKQDVTKALEAIKNSNIFDAEFFENTKLVSYRKDRAMLFEKGEMNEVSAENFKMSDFLYGRRTDFIGINPKKEFLDQMLQTDKLSDKKVIPFMFLKGLLTYDEFVAHEMAHTLFDVEYKKRFGEYVEINEITDVSEEYRDVVMSKIKNLCLKYFPYLEAERFVFSRQQIAEIFAQLYQREFCKRVGQNIALHNEQFEIMEDFLANPQEALNEFNRQKGRNCSMEDFYTENHVLSLIVAPIMEKEFPDFKRCIDWLWHN